MTRYLQALLNDADRACLAVAAEEGETDWESYLERTFWQDDLFPHPDSDPVAWVLDVVEAQPGIWIAELCRIKHDIPSNRKGIAYCGHCIEYANLRKRKRAAGLGPLLPGFEAGAHQLHSACSTRGLTWLRKLVERLAKTGKLIKKIRAIIPDQAQARGWDFGSRLYPLASSYPEDVSETH